MTILNTLKLKCNSNIKINFDGGDLSSDAGLFLIKEFISKMGIDRIIEKCFATNGKTLPRRHSDKDNLLQIIYQTIAGYFQDDCADELKSDPVFKLLLEKDALASQPTLSRFHNRLELDSLMRLKKIQRLIRKAVYSIDLPEQAVLDIDSTLFNTYGKQYGSDYNGHYCSRGYHPLLCYDAFNGDLLGIRLRNGADYCCKDAELFMLPILEEYRQEYPSVDVYVRGDSGFASPKLYDLCEEQDVKYAIRLKSNAVLVSLSQYLYDKVTEIHDMNPTEDSTVYGEFMYQAKSWSKPRRVVCKVEWLAAELFPNQQVFVITNMESSPKDIIAFYSKRGLMENFIKEGKNGFDYGAVSNKSKLVNANNVEIRALAYNIFNFFRRLSLPASMKRLTIDTIRIKLMKIAARLVSSGRYRIVKMCSSCPYKTSFYDTLSNIGRLQI